MPEIPSWYYDSLPPWGDFQTNPKLTHKVDALSGRLVPFHGETTVFLLEAEDRAWLGSLQDALYAACGDMLSTQRLIEDSFHLTLHDLWNEGDVERHPAPTYSHEEVLSVLACIRRVHAAPISMRCIAMLNMVSTSVVLGLVPATDEDQWRLDDMYSRLQSVYPVKYGLTPHITLAYYRPGTYGEELWGKLRNVFPIAERPLSLSTEKLVFQSFQDMNRYHTI